MSVLLQTVLPLDVFVLQYRSLFCLGYMSVLQQPVLSLDLDVSVLCAAPGRVLYVLLQPVLPLDVCVTANCASLDVSVLKQTLLSLDVSILQLYVPPLNMSVQQLTLLSLNSVPVGVCCTAGVVHLCLYIVRTCLPTRALVLHLDVPVYKSLCVLHFGVRWAARIFWFLIFCVFSLCFKTVLFCSPVPIQIRNTESDRNFF